MDGWRAPPFEPANGSGNADGEEEVVVAMPNRQAIEAAHAPRTATRKVDGDSARKLWFQVVRLLREVRANAVRKYLGGSPKHITQLEEHVPSDRLNALYDTAKDEMEIRNRSFGRLAQRTSELAAKKRGTVAGDVLAAVCEVLQDQAVPCIRLTRETIVGLKEVTQEETAGHEAQFIAILDEAVENMNEVDKIAEDTSEADIEAARGFSEFHQVVAQADAEAVRAVMRRKAAKQILDKMEERLENLEKSSNQSQRDIHRYEEEMRDQLLALNARVDAFLQEKRALLAQHDFSAATAIQDVHGAYWKAIKTERRFSEADMAVSNAALLDTMTMEANRFVRSLALVRSGSSKVSSSE